MTQPQAHQISEIYIGQYIRFRNLLSQLHPELQAQAHADSLISLEHGIVFCETHLNQPGVMQALQDAEAVCP